MLTALLISILVIVAVAVTSSSKPQGPPPDQKLPTPGTGSIQRVFTWYHAINHVTRELRHEVFFEQDSIDRARGFLMDTKPSKTYQVSNYECYIVAKQLILDSEIGFDAKEVNQVIDYITYLHYKYYLSNFELVNLVLSFVHEDSIPYSYDKDSTGYSEYLRAPIETLFDQTGDCDCKAILAIAILRQMGCPVAFLLMPGHAALAVGHEQKLPYTSLYAEGLYWYYCESTGDNWTAGMVPEDITWSDVNLYIL